MPVRRIEVIEMPVKAPARDNLDWIVGSAAFLFGILAIILVLTNR